jgi:hypothetical protein
MSRRAALWIVFVLVSIAATVATRQYFAVAFPIVSVDLRMDREQALRRAGDLAARHRLGPPGYRQAATFDGDSEVQTYVELEAGGKEVFARMIRGDRYAPYTWRVRHFHEHDAHETWIRFTPAGAAYGFAEKLPEDAPGAHLDPADARAIAERGATAWRVPLAEFTLVEQAQEEKPGGRVDHTFVYERPDRIGDARYRVRLVVAGDRLVEVTRFVRVPEAFERKYQQMRSANEAIGFGAGIATLLLYGIGGIVIGLFVLLRHRWVLWRPALMWAAVVAGLQVLATLNEWPLVWVHYDTALATTTFLAQQAVSVAAAAVAMTVVFALSFMAAEGLSRRAFPHHLQLWRAWSPQAGASREVFAQTTIGYLLVPVFFAYEVALYFAASRWLGWWSPSDALIHPDVLATYLPWLSAIAPSVQAGFWEECLFRAVPLAGAALIGDRLGRRRTCLAIALVVQAVVFGAGHAPYPNQPAYARPVELVLPSLIFGAVYLRYGLLPGIVLHVAFDTVWFALPLFVSRAPGIILDRLLVVVLVLVPVWILLYRRVQARAWTELAPAFLNGAWRPAQHAEAAPALRPVQRGAPQPWLTRVVVGAGIAGAVAWAINVVWYGRDAPALQPNRDAAIALATTAMRDRGARLEGWRIFAAVDAEPDDAHVFVHATAGKDASRDLLGTYLPGPHWQVRAARFEGDIAARAEEWGAAVERGAVTRVRHVLPESVAGAALGVEEARDLARAAIRQRFAIAPDRLRDISIVPVKLPARTDWNVVFEDLSRQALPRGELRVAVAIAGREVADAWRFVYIPEQWQRDMRDRRTIAGVVRAAGLALVGGLLLAFAARAIVRWSRGHAPARWTLPVFLMLAGARALGFANEWPARLSEFLTTQPFELQAAYLAIGLILGATLVPALVALAAGGIQAWAAPPFARGRTLQLGIGLGTAAAGVLAIASLARAGIEPVWPSYDGAETIVPAAALPLATIASIVTRSAALAVILAAADRLSEGWTRHRWRTALFLMIGGALAGAGTPGPDLGRWLAGGAVVGIFLLAAYALVLRWDLAPLPIAVVTMSVLAALAAGFADPYPGASAGAVAAVVLGGSCAWRAWRWTAMRPER